MVWQSAIKGIVKPEFFASFYKDMRGRFNTQDSLFSKKCTNQDDSF
jgi:hypothetical protein